jgi:crotonobetainyl-CoA:carnitine CoA-transferase CaiB-like acyl-CoA transferase
MDGVKVLEVGLFGLVPSAGAVLADWGADVVKVEHPETGDPMRGLAAWGIQPGTGGFNYLWEVCNRGKRSVGVDIATPAGLELVLGLSEDADVFLTSFLGPARRRLGIDVEHIRARNPRIVYGRGSGYGPLGPEADAPGFDGVAYWFRSGMGEAATPAEAAHPAGQPSPAMGDLQTGMNLAGGVAAALFHRERTGVTTVVDASLFAAGLWAMQGAIVGSQVAGWQQLPKIDREGVSNPLTITYRTSDGRHISLMMLSSDRYWRPFCETIGAPALADDPRFVMARDRYRHSVECVAALESVFARRTLAEWVTVLSHQEGPWSIVQVAGEAGVDDQARANGYVQRVEYDQDRALSLIAAPVTFDEAVAPLRPAPAHGADTEEVLLERGMTWDEIIALKTEGAIL